ncbi:ATP-dependent Clp protease adaptor ClpS [Cyclobacterium sp. 1_MG-2023]|uniref:ATP-dependent Clp protease adaptor protein ClpS n=1 Tax=Cyclobacterium marinum (strain ATCC 25205 / DSM 745 / LMG 13164 / NCIMB 1802) TaxID=880070 RepID=G0IUF2_CYCMS|nr:MULTISPECIES: ATP-dependent Clp protease adaptor ClpS [Cyclobacterium]AEL24147.1 ATP-dependent Clp protease adaptor protein ClpS [Cyclobacterium marinum DSM 745]MBI0398853.1 ATP-dependent Clp protease adaptor ClpS [Cyclobacterium marinum]MBR9774221.1 ATP-dependent Clp protease adaptor ClpS [Cytophagales bacterium]MDO6436546.1 ATP-dependent Clp protease adaptor ClpS [Cyclobacterium sp. 1_MG-2023]|tara:strand:+ start:41802 stop:42089 length:288 start_codon:yes stop_codon:yes gene_type:complete
MKPLEHLFESEEELLVEELVDKEEHDLVVFNDDVNTFDHVSKVLIKVCKHTQEQAEQCTMIIHYKGKCSVKKGSVSKLKPMCESILEAGIQATIV